ncbi:hypothetical protein [Nocardia sp. CA-135398]|uniref:hypothetical protein n=1 Tax=Nocardia sp. CA-135398 TaxID=3239977 RepID=UPI003D98BAB4
MAMRSETIERRADVPTAPGRVPVLGHLPAVSRRPLVFVRECGALAPMTRVYLGPLAAYLVSNRISFAR